LQSGSKALNARINSVIQFNEAVIHNDNNNSSAKILGLPSDCPPPIKDSSGGQRQYVPTCPDCYSSSDDGNDSDNSSANDDVDGRDIIQRERSKEKELKDFAFSRTLAHFQVDGVVLFLLTTITTQQIHILT
jgi:hypothetical protein